MDIEGRAMNRKKASTHLAMPAGSSGRGGAGNGALEGKDELEEGDHELEGVDTLEEVGEVALEAGVGVMLEGGGEDVGGPE